VTATPREGNLVTVKLDRDVVARLAALKVTYGRRFILRGYLRPPPYKVVLLLKPLKQISLSILGPIYSLSQIGGFRHV